MGNYFIFVVHFFIMATIKFLIQSKSENVPIYLRLSLGRSMSFKRKTSLFIKPSNWSKKTGFPKQNYPQDKNTSSILRGLQNYIFNELNDSNANGTQLDSEWLQLKINNYFNKPELDSLDLLTVYGAAFIDNLQYKVNLRSKSKGVSISTEKKYRTIVNKLISFEELKKKKYKLYDVNLSFRTDFINYLSDVDRLSDNTIGRYLKIVKSICLDAKKNGHEVSSQLDFFQGYTVKAPKVILTIKELNQIKLTKFSDEKLQITKDWLIIGFFTGQRVSDLLRMKRSFIQEIQGFEFIVLEQIKTKKTVQIPLHPEVQEVLDKRNGDFPPKFSINLDSGKAMFNRYLKQICKIAGINTIVNGNKFDEKQKRNINGMYPKHELVASHICRRSFASAFYATELYPTPLLMNITAHSTEKMFLEYIGKEPIDYSVQLAKIWKNLSCN